MKKLFCLLMLSLFSLESADYQQGDLYRRLLLDIEYAKMEDFKDFIANHSEEIQWNDKMVLADLPPKYILEYAVGMGRIYFAIELLTSPLTKDKIDINLRSEDGFGGYHDPLLINLARRIQVPEKNPELNESRKRLFRLLLERGASLNEEYRGLPVLEYIRQNQPKAYEYYQSLNQEQEQE